MCHNGLFTAGKCPHHTQEMVDPVTSPTPTAAASAATASTPRIGPMLAALMLAAFIAILNETVLSVALPQLMIDFDITADVAQWLTTGFLLTMAVVIPTTGFLTAKLSRRALFLIAMGTFMVGTLLAALSPSFEIMLLARIVQAFGTAIIMPLLMSTTIKLVAPQNRGMMMGMNAVVISVGPAIGPTLAGVVMNFFTWHYVFIFMLPIAAIITVFGALVLRVPADGNAPKLDLVSVLLSAIGFGGLVYALATFSEILSGSVPAIAIGIVGIIGLVLFIRRQLQRAPQGKALLDLRVFAVPAFTRSVVLVAIAFAVMLGAVIILPIYFQDGRGLSVLETGLLLLGGGLTQAIAAPIFGRLFDKVGARPIVVPGTVVLVLASIALAALPGTTPVGWFVVAYVALSVGIASILSTMMTMSMGSLEPRLIGQGSAIINTAQQLGGAIGTAALVAALTIGGSVATSAEAAVVSGSSVAFIVAAALSVVAFVLALFVRPLARQH